MMRSLVVMFFLASAAQAHDEKPAMTQGLTDKFFDRAIRGSPLYHGDMDSTMLGKPGHVSVSPLTSYSRPLPPVRAFHSGSSWPKRKGKDMPFIQKSITHSHLKDISSDAKRIVKAGSLDELDELNDLGMRFGFQEANTRQRAKSLLRNINFDDITPENARSGASMDGWQ